MRNHTRPSSALLTRRQRSLSRRLQLPPLLGLSRWLALDPLAPCFTPGSSGSDNEMLTSILADMSCPNLLVDMEMLGMGHFHFVSFWRIVKSQAWKGPSRALYRLHLRLVPTVASLPSLIVTCSTCTCVRICLGRFQAPGTRWGMRLPGGSLTGA